MSPAMQIAVERGILAARGEPTPEVLEEAARRIELATRRHGHVGTSYAILVGKSVVFDAKRRAAAAENRQARDEARRQAEEAERSAAAAALAVAIERGADISRRRLSSALRRALAEGLAAVGAMATGSYAPPGHHGGDPRAAWREQQDRRRGLLLLVEGRVPGYKKIAAEPLPADDPLRTWIAPRRQISGSAGPGLASR